jgi:hypothetical protein
LRRFGRILLDLAKFGFGFAERRAGVANDERRVILADGMLSGAMLDGAGDSEPIALSPQNGMAILPVNG